MLDADASDLHLSSGTPPMIRLHGTMKALPGEQPLDPAKLEQIIAIWLQMGKVELLRGNLVFDAATDGGAKPASREVLVEAVRHYLLSVAYFELYSDRTRNIQKAFLQMYNRLKGNSYDDLSYLQDIALPAIAAEYKIKMERFGQFYRDTLGLALQL